MTVWLGRIQNWIKEYPLLIFSKTTCSYCNQLKGLLDGLHVHYTAMELDTMEGGDEKKILAGLYDLTGQKTVPNVFIHGEHVGGYDAIHQLHQKGLLQETLKKKDRAFEYDLTVIGGGSGGIACAREAVRLGKKVCLLDYVKPSPWGSVWGLGGTCVNVGCIPKKLFHQASLLGEAWQDGESYGWYMGDDKENAFTHNKQRKHNWQKLCDEVHSYICSLNFGYRGQLADANIDYFNALGSIYNEHTVHATTFDRKTKQAKEPKVISTNKIVLAMGGRPRYLDLPNAKELCITSDDLFTLKRPPGKTLVVGASYIALECAGFLSALGFDTTVMARSLFLRSFDQEMAGKIVDYMQKNPDHNSTKFIREAVPIALERVMVNGTEANHNGAQVHSTPVKVTWKRKEGNVDVIESDVFDTVLLAVGRDPSIQNTTLENLGIRHDPITFKILVDDEDQTSLKNVYAVGDIVHGRPELTPVAIQTGRLLARRLFANDKEKVVYEKIPTTVFTPLEYAACGLSEEEARARFDPNDIEVYHAHFKPLEWNLPRRAMNACFIKMICHVSDKDRILGLHVLAPNAGEIMQGYAVALSMNATKKDFERTITIHPTNSEEIIRTHITKSSGESSVVTWCCG